MASSLQCDMCGKSESEAFYRVEKLSDGKNVGSYVFCSIRCIQKKLGKAKIKRLGDIVKSEIDSAVAILKEPFSKAKEPETPEQIMAGYAKEAGEMQEVDANKKIQLSYTPKNPPPYVAEGLASGQFYVRGTKDMEYVRKMIQESLFRKPLKMEESEKYFTIDATTNKVVFNKVPRGIFDQLKVKGIILDYIKQ